MYNKSYPEIAFGFPCPSSQQPVGGMCDRAFLFSSPLMPCFAPIVTFQPLVISFLFKEAFWLSQGFSKCGSQCLQALQYTHRVLWVSPGASPTCTPSVLPSWIFQDPRWWCLNLTSPGHCHLVSCQILQDLGIAILDFVRSMMVATSIVGKR